LAVKEAMVGEWNFLVCDERDDECGGECDDERDDVCGGECEDVRDDVRDGECVCGDDRCPVDGEEGSFDGMRWMGEG